MSETTQEQTLEIIGSDKLYQITKAEIDQQVATAKAYPRSIRQAMLEAESIVLRNKNAAMACNYSTPRGGKTISGPSIRLAEAIVSTYGNIRWGARVLSRTDKVIVAQGYCHDLERNVRYECEEERSIVDRNGRTYSADMQVVTGKACMAIAMRNAALKVIPRTLVDELYEKSKKMVQDDDAKNLPDRIKECVKYFNDLGIKTEQILAKIERKYVEDINLEDIYYLGGLVNGIKHGEYTAAEAFKIESAQSQTAKSDEQLKDL